MRALQALDAQGALRPIDSAFATLLRERLGADPAVALAGALAMRAVALGHSGFVLAEAGALLAALDAEVVLPAHADWAAALRASRHVALHARAISHADADRAATGDDASSTAAASSSRLQDATAMLVFEHGRVCLARYARYEQDLAERIIARARSGTPAVEDEPALASRIAKLFGHAPSEAATDARAPDRQALAATMALQRRLLLITGGPGTGKTTTVARLLALQIEVARMRGDPAPRIALAAPTGRAAVRLGEAIEIQARRDLEAGRIDADTAAAIPRQAQTLHRLLGWRPGRVAFRHDADHPLPFDLIVVDEASMVDLPLMAKLFAAAPTQATLVLLGDPDQLPAVEAGDVLGELCRAAGDGLTLSAVDAPVTDTHAHPLAGTRVHLLQAWRQAEAGALRDLAEALREGDRDAVFDRLREEDAALQWQHGDIAALTEILRARTLPHWQAIADAADPAMALEAASRLRVLTALRRGPFGAEHWNAWYAIELGAREPFFHGRLIAIAANSPSHGLYNGDLGVVWRESRGEAAVWFRTAEGLRPWRCGQLPAHASAFATTVHKAQGSEFDETILILPDADTRVLSRELLYTALTRARRQVLLWSHPATLERALARRTWRDSGLETRLNALSGF
ncbi:MAG: exodeoxyribonuclease V subunit alpha [Lysobacteraceae bacterium]|nr:MAG: exodeoxyribonuclease V subunit alpha [Xanthomonadaceae bacterium]